MTNVPNPTDFTSAPLRNRLRVTLKAPVSEVWALVGDPGRMPEYSAGLERVVVSRDPSGQPASFVCTFKPTEAGGEGVVSRDRVRWWTADRGWASSGAAADAFGLENDLHMVTVEPAQDGVTVTWSAYYNAADLQMMKTHFDDALADIGANLVRRFGGSIQERFLER
jgi:hypothetical protein